MPGSIQVAVRNPEAAFLIHYRMQIMAHDVLQLSAIEAVSPTLAEVLRLCKLRAGLSRAANAENYVLGNPKAWLGNAYHAVLQAVGSVQLDGLEARVRRVWEAAIHSEYERARTHHLDKRFGSPESWPGYHIVAAMALIRAKELARVGTQPECIDRVTMPVVAIRKKKFSAANGKIVGYPDAVRSGEVLDFKSGDVFEDERQDQIKRSYVRQLRIYGLLVRESLGWWPRRGVLLPMSGPPVAVGLEPDDCEKEAAEAVQLLEDYNADIAAGRGHVELASPSAMTCRWCPFKLVCMAFWRSVSPSWSGQLDGAVVEGTADKAPCSIHDGSAMALSVSAHAGTEGPGHFQIAPLAPATHPAITMLSTGEQVRLVGLRVRPDCTLVPTQRTVIARGADLPSITVVKSL